MSFEYLYNSLLEIMHIVHFQHCFSCVTLGKVRTIYASALVSTYFWYVNNIADKSWFGLEMHLHAENVESIPQHCKVLGATNQYEKRKRWTIIYLA